MTYLSFKDITSTQSSPVHLSTRPFSLCWFALLVNPRYLQLFQTPHTEETLREHPCLILLSHQLINPSQKLPAVSNFIGLKPIACLCLNASLRMESETSTFFQTKGIHHLGPRLHWQTQQFRMRINEIWVLFLARRKHLPVRQPTMSVIQSLCVGTVKYPFVSQKVILIGLLHK